MHLFLRLLLCAGLIGLFTACSSTNSPGGQSGDRDAMVDGGDSDGGPPSNKPDGSTPPPKGDGGTTKPPQAGTDEPPPPAGPAGPTSISPSGGAAVGKSDNYRLQVSVGAPAPMNEGSSENFKLRIGARLQ